MVSDLLIMSLKLILAGVLGGIVGFERERREHPAGLRTHILVCLGSALIMIISQSFSSRGDPARIAAQIVSGIGFLGAGTILQQGSVVRGLTTAASLWTVAGIGMAVGVGSELTIYAWLAVIATLIVFITLSSTRYLESFWAKGMIQDVDFEIPADGPDIIVDIIKRLHSMGVTLEYMKSASVQDLKKNRWHLRIVIPCSINKEDIIAIFTSEKDLTRFEWR